jgi:ATP-dependent DNA ligase
MKKKEFGPLYAKASNGKIKTWSCVVAEDKGTVTLNVIHGYEDGKKTVDTRTVEPKNIGKSNETTPWDQGLSEAESKQNKKRDEGYLDTISDVADTEISLPMLAQKYEERKHYLKWPCFVQPKLNGVRCTTRRNVDTNVEYVSRKGKFYTILDHMTKEVEDFLDYVGVGDGEIFNPEFTFQEICSAVKKEREDTKELEYWIYDIVDTKLTFEERNSEIKKFFDEYSKEKNSLGFRKYGPLVEVPTYEVADEKEFKKYHKIFTEEWKFEGTMLRNKDGKYILKHRSNDLLKYKDFMDAEFEIIGAKEATGNDVGTVVFRCKTQDGKEFDVRPKGSRKLRKKWLKEIDKLIGKELTCKFQCYSDDGIPIFATGLAIRDYE